MFEHQELPSQEVHQHGRKRHDQIDEILVQRKSRNQVGPERGAKKKCRDCQKVEQADFNQPPVPTGLENPTAVGHVGDYIRQQEGNGKGPEKIPSPLSAPLVNIRRQHGFVEQRENRQMHTCANCTCQCILGELNRSLRLVLDESL